MQHTRNITLAALFGYITAQNIGNQKAEFHPKMNLGKCTTANGCTTSTNSITMDANWRWLHNTGGYTNCYDGNSWSSQFCPDPDTCSANCALDGVPSEDWGNVYGIQHNGDDLTIGFVTKNGQTGGMNVGARTYMMNSAYSYEMFMLKNQEFTFDVDVSNMPCGINGALYFVQMDADGGKSKSQANKAGAQYGTGYCDAQCPQDIKFINGEANVNGWNPSPSDPNAGKGQWGSCCAEMDIWEANSISSAYTAHPCVNDGLFRCENETDCGNTDRYKGAVCDQDGCDLNPFRAGVEDFFGPGSQFKVDTTKPFTVVTQFHTSDGTATGDLSEIKRIFVQDGQVIEHPDSKMDGMDKQFNSITDEMCEKTKGIFEDENDFKTKGGLKKMGEAMDKGMVLVMSLWDDHAANMLWLDSTYPKDKTALGGPRGTCGTDSGVPADVEANSPNSSVKFSNIKVGDFGSTYPSGPTPPGPTPGDCPGGSLQACIGLCPSDATAFQACVAVCQQKCETTSSFIQ